MNAKIRTNHFDSQTSLVTDWYIPEENHEHAFIYPGPVTVTGSQIDDARALLQLAKNACYRKDSVGENGRVIEIIDDYRIKYNGKFLRGHRQLNVEGILHILRATPAEVPSSSQLGIPDQILRLLCGKKFGESGGLVIICGQPGHGKSTTCASVILERVKKYGSFCLTVEDPPEFALSGLYDSENNKMGRIIQVPATNGDFSRVLKEALRCYPSNSKGSMLFVGEVRDSQSAVQVLRAATTGQLVFMTTHAGDIVSAIDRLISLSNGEIHNQNESASILSSCLRGIIHQELKDGKLNITSLFAGKPDTAVGNLIRANKTRNLSTEINSQQTQLGLGSLEEYVINSLI